MKDSIGNEVVVGDTIVYFTRQGSSMYSQKARVELIAPGADTYYTGRPCILVKREDAEQKNSFTRKAWLWSFKNAVKINSTTVTTETVDYGCRVPECKLCYGTVL